MLYSLLVVQKEHC